MFNLSYFDNLVTYSEKFDTVLFSNCLKTPNAQRAVLRDGGTTPADNFVGT